MVMDSVQMERRWRESVMRMCMIGKGSGFGIGNGTATETVVGMVVRMVRSCYGECCGSGN